MGSAEEEEISWKEAKQEIWMARPSLEASGSQEKSFSVQKLW